MGFVAEIVHPSASTIKMAIKVCTLGLAAAMLPELKKIHTDPSSAANLSASFLIFRMLFFGGLGWALLAKDEE